MQPITIRALEGGRVARTQWVISEGTQDLDEADTKKEAVSRARNTWAAPGQPIKVVKTNGEVEQVREGDTAKQPSMNGTGDAGGFGGGLFDGGLF